MVCHPPPSLMGDRRVAGDARGRLSQPPQPPAGDGHRRMASATALAQPARRRTGAGGRPDRRPLPGQEERGLHARPRLTPEEINANYNNFYEYGTQKEIAAAAQQLVIAALGDRHRRAGRAADDARLRRSRAQDAAGDAALPPPLRRGLVDDHPVDGLSAEGAGGSGQAARRRRNSSRFETFLDPDDGARPEQLSLSVALCRGRDDGGSGQRPRLHRHRRLRQADRQAARRAAAAAPAVEIRLQVDQVDPQDLASSRSGRSGLWEAIQPSEYGFWANVNPEVPHPRWSQATRARAAYRRTRADAAVQRLCRAGGGPLCRHGCDVALYVRFCRCADFAVHDLPESCARDHRAQRSGRQSCEVEKPRAGDRASKTILEGAEVCGERGQVQTTKKPDRWDPAIV